METTIDYASDYGGEASDYQTTMEGKQETENDYRFCPLKLHALLSTPEAVLGTSDYRGGGGVQKKYMRLVGRRQVPLRRAISGPQQIIIPRLAPGGVGRGCFVPCGAFCGPLWGVLVAGSI